MNQAYASFIQQVNNVLYSRETFNSKNDGCPQLVMSIEIYKEKKTDKK